MISTLPSEHCIKSRKRQHSDDLDLSDDELASTPKSSTPSMEDDRRAHHNELERRRRDHIKDHFTTLKKAIPLLDGEKSSRAMILKRSVEYINALQAKIAESQASLEQLRKRNEQLEAKLCQPAPEPVVSFQLASTSTAQPSLQLNSCSSPSNAIPLTSLTTSELLQLSQALIAATAPSPPLPALSSHLIPTSTLLPQHPLPMLSLPF